MDYHRIYKDFIKDRIEKEQLTTGGYFERHHIMPKSLGGADDKENIVCLTASDHLFSHKLLALIYGGKMWHALNMCHIADSAARGVRLSRRWYEILRRERSKHIKKTRSGKNHHHYGKKFSEKHRKNLSISHMGQRTGKDNNKYDPNIYDFRNFDGRHERLTKLDFRKKHGMSSVRVSDICLGNRPSAHGWYVSSIEIEKDIISKKGTHHGSVLKEKHHFKHKSGMEEFFSQYEMRQKYPELNQSHLSSVCRRVRPVHKGWRLAE